MALTNQGSLGTANSKTSGATVVITTTADAFAGDLVFVYTAWDNNNSATQTGPENDTWTVTDSAGNTYDFWAGGEDNSSNNRAAAGILCSVLAYDLPSGGTITVQYNSNRTAKAAGAHRFSKSAGTSIRRMTSVHAWGRVVDPMPLHVDWHALSGEQVLVLHMLASEGPVGDAFTWDSSFTQCAHDGTTGGTETTNMTLRAGFLITNAVAEVTCDVTSDTADRDHTVLMCLAYEMPATPDAVAPYDPIYDNTAFQHRGLVGWSRKGATDSSQAASPSNFLRIPVVAPAGAMLTVHAGWKSSNTTTSVGPSDTTMNCGDTQGHTYTKLAGSMYAASSGEWSVLFRTILTNDLVKGDFVELWDGTGNKIHTRVGMVHGWSIEGDPPVLEAVTHLHGNGEPAEISLASLTGGHKYLFLENMCYAGSTPVYDPDVDYTLLDAFGTNGSNPKSVASSYRIAEITSDGVDASLTPDARHTHVLVALRTTSVASPALPFFPKTIIF